MTEEDGLAWGGTNGTRVSQDVRVEEARVGAPATQGEADGKRDSITQSQASNDKAGGTVATVREGEIFGKTGVGTSGIKVRIYGSDQGVPWVPAASTQEATALGVEKFICNGTAVKQCSALPREHTDQHRQPLQRTVDSEGSACDKPDTGRGEPAMPGSRVSERINRARPSPTTRVGEQDGETRPFADLLHISEVERRVDRQDFQGREETVRVGQDVDHHYDHAEQRTDQVIRPVGRLELEEGSEVPQETSCDVSDLNVPRVPAEGGLKCKLTTAADEFGQTSYEYSPATPGANRGGERENSTSVVEPDIECSTRVGRVVDHHYDHSGQSTDRTSTADRVEESEGAEEARDNGITSCQNSIVPAGALPATTPLSPRVRRRLNEQGPTMPSKRENRPWENYETQEPSTRIDQDGSVLSPSKQKETSREGEVNRPSHSPEVQPIRLLAVPVETPSTQVDPRSVPVSRREARDRYDETTVADVGSPVLVHNLVGQINDST